MRKHQDKIALVISLGWLVLAFLAYSGSYVPTIEQIAGTVCFGMAFITRLILSK